MKLFDACANLTPDQRLQLRDLLLENHADSMPELPTRLVAYVESDTALPDGIKTDLARTLPTAAVPDDVHVVTKLPHLPNGKIDRDALVAMENSDPVVTTDTHPLAKIWSGLLPGADVTPDAHFFNLGGHSLMVLQLVEQIENDCGVTLRPADLFQAPTYRQQLQLIEDNAQSDTQEFHHLVPLREGGAKPPLFLVKTGAIGPELVKKLDPEVPIYLLRGIAHRPEGNWRRWKNLRDLAAEMLEEVKAVHPTGPYFLGGYSVGGLIAWELARLLEEQGEKVLSLWLFDPAVPNIFSRGPLTLQLNRGVKRPDAYSLLGALGCWLSENHPFGQRLYRKTAHRFLLMPWRRQRATKGARLREQGGRLSAGMLEADFSVASYEYHRNWKPFEYEGNTLLVYTTQTPFNTHQLIAPWFPGDFKAESFDCGHLDMGTKPEHVERVIEALNREVDRGTADTGS